MGGCLCANEDVRDGAFMAEVAEEGRAAEDWAGCDDDDDDDAVREY